MTSIGAVLAEAPRLCHASSGCGSNSTCSLGFTGDFCKDCATGFYRRRNSCFACSDAAPALVFAGVSIVVAGFVSMMLLMPMSETARFSLFALLLNMVQFLSTLSHDDMQWPSSIQQLLDVMTFFSLDVDLAAPDCVAPLSTIGKLATSMLMPVIICALVWMLGAAIWFATNVCCRGTLLDSDTEDDYAAAGVDMGTSKTRSERLRDWWGRMARTVWPRCMRGTLVVAFMAYMVVSRRVFNVFACEDLGDGTYMSVDLQLSCDSTEYTNLRALALVGLALFPVGIFVAFTLLITRYIRYHLDSPQCRATMGLLFTTYSNNFYMWELVVMAKRLLLVAVAGFLVRDSEAVFRYVFYILILVLYILAVALVRPYTDEISNQAAIALNALQFYIAFCGVVFSAIGRSGADLIEGSAADRTSRLAQSSIYCLFVLVVGLVVVWMMLRRRRQALHKTTHRPKKRRLMSIVAEMDQTSSSGVDTTWRSNPLQSLGSRRQRTPKRRMSRLYHWRANPLQATAEDDSGKSDPRPAE